MRKQEKWPEWKTCCATFTTAHFLGHWWKMVRTCTSSTVEIDNGPAFLAAIERWWSWARHNKPKVKSSQLHTVRVTERTADNVVSRIIGANRSRLYVATRRRQQTRSCLVVFSLRQLAERPDRPLPVVIASTTEHEKPAVCKSISIRSRWSKVTERDGMENRQTMQMLHIRSQRYCWLYGAVGLQ